MIDLVPLIAFAAEDPRFGGLMSLPVGEKRLAIATNGRVLYAVKGVLAPIPDLPSEYVAQTKGVALARPMVLGNITVERLEEWATRGRTTGPCHATPKLRAGPDGHAHEWCEACDGAGETGGRCRAGWIGGVYLNREQLRLALAVCPRGETVVVGTIDGVNGDGGERTAAVVDGGGWRLVVMGMGVGTWTRPDDPRLVVNA